MNLTPYLIAWIVLGLVLAVIAIMRRGTAEKEDDSLHLSAAEEGATSQQVVVAKKLETMDRWCKILIILLILTGVVLAGLYLMQMWESSSRVGLK